MPTLEPGACLFEGCKEVKGPLLKRSKALYKATSATSSTPAALVWLFRSCRTTHGLNVKARLRSNTSSTSSRDTGCAQTTQFCSRCQCTGWGYKTVPGGSPSVPQRSYCQTCDFSLFWRGYFIYCFVGFIVAEPGAAKQENDLAEMRTLLSSLAGWW